VSTRPGTTTVVMVIDVQRAVMESAWDRDGVVARIRALIRRARSKQVPIVFVQHHDLDGDGLARGTDGWKFVEAVAPRDDDMLVEKNYPDSFADTELAGILAELGAGHLVIAGAQTDACIRATAHRALAEGYDVTLVEDCHTTEDATFDDVVVPAQQIVVHTNLCLWSITYPGQVSTLAPHDEVRFEQPVSV